MKVDHGNYFYSYIHKMYINMKLKIKEKKELIEMYKR